MVVGMAVRTPRAMDSVGTAYLKSGSCKVSYIAPVNIPPHHNYSHLKVNVGTSAYNYSNSNCFKQRLSST